jgi:hypothetical protein
VWTKDDPAGVEQCELAIDSGGLVARSVAIGLAPVPYRLDLELTTGADWVTQRLSATALGDRWTRTLVLERNAAGVWAGSRSNDGSRLPDIGDAGRDDAVEPENIPSRVLDVDVQWSPVTNIMPVRRLGLDRAGAADTFTMAWVSVPSLTVTLDEQHYTLLGVDNGDLCARFESSDGFFTAVIRCDPDGVPIDYPGIARRVR